MHASILMVCPLATGRRAHRSTPLFCEACGLVGCGATCAEPEATAHGLTRHVVSVCPKTY